MNTRGRSFAGARTVTTRVQADSVSSRAIPVSDGILDMGEGVSGYRQGAVE